MNSAKMVFVTLLCFVGLPYILSQMTYKNRTIYDIANDPYETIDLSQNQEYLSKYLNALEERRVYWSQYSIPTNEPDAVLKSEAFRRTGRVGPWLNATTSLRKIQQLYSYEDAPHIIFCLIDDWGYNDFGKISTYMTWTTPTIDRLAEEGIHISNYYTNEVCAPSRASLMTGRYVLRLGVFSNVAELPLTEVTLAEELKSAGYRNYMIGKWHLGLSTPTHLPINRGFDYFYGFLLGDSHYWSKKYGKFFDLMENDQSVTKKSELDNSLHSAYLFQSKAEDAIKFHAENYPTTPMFLYYSFQLIHSPWTVPLKYLERCIPQNDGAYDPFDDDEGRSSDMLIENYCGMNVMVDEAIANLTCTLEKYGFNNNTVLIISGDNGGEYHINGNSFPFNGHKGSWNRGGISNNAIIHSKLLPNSRIGTTYDGVVHITGTQWVAS